MDIPKEKIPVTKFTERVYKNEEKKKVEDKEYIDKYFSKDFLVKYFQNN